MPRSLKSIEPLEPRRLLAAVAFDNGGGTASWNNPLNWSTDALPQPGDDVTIAPIPGVTNIAVSGVTADVRSITVSASVILNQNANLTVSDAFHVANGGNVRFLSRSRLGGAGTLTIDAGGTWSCNDIGSSPASGAFSIAAIDNYGDFTFSGDPLGGLGTDADLAPAFHNYGTATAVEGGFYYGAVYNETGATLRVRYLPSSPGGEATFGVARGPNGTTVSAPFVNRGLMIGGSTNGTATPTGIGSRSGQPIAIVVDGSPTIGGTWQFGGGGYVAFRSLDANAPATAAFDSTFSLVSGTLEFRNVNVTARGLADGTGVYIHEFSGTPGMLTLAQPRTSLGQMEVSTGTLRLAAGGEVLRSSGVTIATAGRLDVGDGLFIDNNAPLGGSPAARPAYAESIRATIGTDTLTVRAANAASTRGDEGVAYAYGAGLYGATASHAILGEAFGDDDFVFRATRRGDNDLDRDVDFNDLLQVASRYGTTNNLGVAGGNFVDPAATNRPVDFADLLALSQNYGQVFAVATDVVAGGRRTRPRVADVLAT